APKEPHDSVEIVLSPKEDRVVVSSYDEGFDVWDLRKGELLYSSRKAHLERRKTEYDWSPRCYSFSPDGRRLAFIKGARVRVIEASTWQTSAGLEKPQEDYGFAVGYSPDGKRL